METSEELATRFAYTADAYQDSADEVGHPDGQPIIETYPALVELIQAAIEADRKLR